MSIFDRAICGDEGLADDLTAEDALGALLRAAAAEEIEFDFFEIEKIEKGFEGCRQWGLRCQGARRERTRFGLKSPRTPDR